MKHIGLLGGTFDPVHLQHIEMAKTALHALHLDQVLFVPTCTPSYRAAPVASDNDRIQMLHCAIDRYPKFSVDLSDLERQCPTYTIDTLQHFKKKHPNDILYFLLGADQWNDLPNWNGYAEFKKLAHFVVFARPGYPLQRTDEFQPLDVLQKKLGGLATLLPIVENAVSATEIRKKLLAKDFENVQGLDSAILKYIQENSLYSAM